MLKESKNKIIAVFQQNIDALKKEIKGIDDKYKKLAEEEKKELKEMLEYWKTQRNALNDGKNLVVVPAAEEQPETPVAEAPVEEEEEKVVDSIFPENNESDEMEDEQEEAVDESVSEENSELSDVWPEETAAEELPVEEEEEKDEPADDNDGWPEFPEEWK